MNRLVQCIIALQLITGTVASTGCVEIWQAVHGNMPGGNGEESGNGGSFPAPGGEDEFMVRLSASNVTPNAGEEVILRCSVASGDDTDVVFDFQPRFGRLVVDEQAGTARFIVDMTDEGIGRSFRCTGRNELGDTDTSEAVIVVTTMSEPPP